MRYFLNSIIEDEKLSRKYQIKICRNYQIKICSNKKDKNNIKNKKNFHDEDRHAKIEQIKIGRTYVNDLVNLVSP